MVKYSFASFSCAIAISAGSIVAQGWEQLTPAQSPPVRVSAAATFDSTRGVVVLFGGATPAGLRLDDTWEWDGSNWNQRAPLHSPPARSSAMMAYDEGRQRTVLFGGVADTGTHVPSEVWEWDGNDWSVIVPPTRAPQISGASMVYHAARGTCIMFGGINVPAQATQSRTFEWDGVDWRERIPTNRPGGRYGFGMSYDADRDRVVISGGRSSYFVWYDDQWEWDGNDWTRVIRPDLPPKAGEISMVYSPEQHVSMRFGGIGESRATIDGTYLWTGVDWVRDTRTQPGPRAGYAMAHDTWRGRTVMFGGEATGTGSYGDTWEYAAAPVASYAPFGSAGCVGTFGTPRIGSVASQRPLLGTTFQVHLTDIPPSGLATIALGFSRDEWAGVSLPVDLGVIGAPGCEVTVRQDVTFGFSNTFGRAVLLITIPVDPTLVGLEFFNQGYAADPAANPLGLVFSNGARGTIGTF